MPAVSAPRQRSSVSFHAGLHCRLRADSTSHRVRAADGCRSRLIRKPMPPEASAASCRRRVSVRPGDSTSAITAPRGRSFRASSVAHSRSSARRAQAIVNLWWSKPSWARPGANRLASGPTQMTWSRPFWRPSRAAKSPVMAAWSPISSWMPPRARPPHGVTLSSSGMPKVVGLASARRVKPVIRATCWRRESSGAGVCMPQQIPGQRKSSQYVLIPRIYA